MSKSYEDAINSLKQDPQPYEENINGEFERIEDSKTVINNTLNELGFENASNYSLDEAALALDSINLDDSEVITRLVNVENKVNTLETNLNGTNLKVDENKSSIESINQNIDTINENINNINTDITTIYDSIDELSTQVNLIPVLPIGVIMIWSGSENAIPNGWSLCNGTNGTPNLTDKFILGAGAKYSVGSTGGEETVTLTVDQIPSHIHEFSRHQASRDETGNGDSGYGVSNKTLDMVTTSTAATGGSQAHNNMPPYYALCYIMHIGIN